MTAHSGELEDNGADPVSRVIALALDWSQGGRIEKRALNQIVEEVELPARYYRELKDALHTAGIEQFDGEDADDSDDLDDERPAMRPGLGEFFKRSGHPLLTAEEEVALAKRLGKGRLAQQALAVGPDMPADQRNDFEARVRDGERAAEEFVRCNVRLVIHNAKHLSRRLTGGLELDDLIQEGYFGLARAVEKFDPSKGFKFSTYATWWIRQSMERALADKGRTIRLPVHYHDQVVAVGRAERAIAAEGREPSVKAVATLLGLSVKRVAELKRDAVHASSLDAPVGDGSATRATFVGDVRIPSVETQVDNAAVREVIAEALLSGLNDRQRLVLQRRFGLGGHKPATLGVIGNDLGVTRERVRQIEVQAIKKLRASRRSLGLTGLVDEEER